MPKIMSGWEKKDKNGVPYISWSPEKALLPIIIDDTKSLASFPNDKKEKPEQPDWILCVDIKKPKEDSEFPFV